MRYHAGQPNLASLFAEVEAETLALGETRVALLVCGDKGIVNSCLRVARRRHGPVQFDAHHQTFSW